MQNAITRILFSTSLSVICISWFCSLNAEVAAEIPAVNRTGAWYLQAAVDIVNGML